MITREDRAYLAGLFEGEGSIYAQIRQYPNGTTQQRSICITLSMTDRMPVELFGDIIGAGSVRGPYNTVTGHNKNWKPKYDYRTNRFEIVQFIVCNIWEWLSPRRREQCIKAIQTYTSFQLVNSPKRLKRV
jgi:hypothetical protein